MHAEPSHWLHEISISKTVRHHFWHGLTPHYKLGVHIYSETSLNPVPNAQVCVYLTLHITKLQLQTTFPKTLYIPHC